MTFYQILLTVLEREGVKTYRWMRKSVFGGCKFHWLDLVLPLISPALEPQEPSDGGEKPLWVVREGEMGFVVG